MSKKPSLAVPAQVIKIFNGDHTDAALKQAIPKLAKNPQFIEAIEASLMAVPTFHQLRLGSATDLSAIPDASVHLVVTSPPYWTLKQYQTSDQQLGDITDYEEFVGRLEEVWKECYRVLVPGGRLIVVVGDVCLSRKAHGRHAVVPLHASIQESCRKLGYDNLAPIIWHKIANAKFEAEGGGGFLGKPYEPNAVVKNDIEFILMQRRPGGYRSPSFEARLMSVISERSHRDWFQQVWNLRGASTRHHPAPFPVELAERLVRMFSFVGDTVLDPFLGSGTTTMAAGRWGRHSCGVEIEPSYLKLAADRIAKDFGLLSSAANVTVDD